MLGKEPEKFARVPFTYPSTERLKTDCSVQAKHMEFAYGIEAMFRTHLPNLKHGNDGLIFTSLEGDYICGTDKYM